MAGKSLVAPLLWLRLGRASNLPTVWTNTLVVAACVGLRNLEILCLAMGGSLLYLAGCTWNDAQDAAWDQQHRPTRPIPAGIVSARTVWLVGGLEVLLGLAVIAYVGLESLLWAVGTVACILLYTKTHKQTPWSVLAMVGCRLLWICSVAAAACSWPAPAYLVALAACILTISLAARREATRGTTGDVWALRWAPLLGMGSVFAAGCWHGTAIQNFFALGLWLGWVLQSYRRMKVSGRPAIGEFVAKSLAGICLLDAAFMGDCWYGLAVCCGCFFLAYFSQRWVPAT
jgi:hypothetical protein